MKKPRAEAPTPAAASPSPSMGERGRSIGYGVIAAIVGFVAVWMYAQGRPAVSKQSRPAVASTIESARFAGNPWHLPNDPTLGFVVVPAGTFLMGSDPAIDSGAYENERWSDAAKQGSVELPAFYIGRYEVTIAQFAAFVAATQRPIDSQTLRGGADLPVTNITWSDAIAYSQWLESELRASVQTPAALKELLDKGWHFT
jgi:serine/threonine-protein kinase